jgi:hypothetical protein
MPAFPVCRCYAGMTRGGLPVGLEIDGPVGSDAKLLGLPRDGICVGLGPGAETLNQDAFSARKVRF